MGTIEREPEVIDNLTSTSTIDALSANQGRVLNEKIPLEVGSLAMVKTVTGSYTVPANGTITIPVEYRSMYFLYSLTNAGTGCAVILTANSSAEVIPIKTSANYDVTASGLNITVKDKTAYGRTMYLTQFALHMNG